LVIVLYGGFGTGAQAEKTYHWDATADRNGFVVVYPDGFRRSWNAGGGCCGPASHDSVDDVGFIADLIRSVTRSENVDPKRVFLTGISNGAAMAYRYACEGALPIAAIGSVSGTMPGGCAAPHPVSALEIHGLKDQNIPFAGGVGTKGVTKVEWPGVEASLDLFRKAERCDATDTKVAGVVTTATANCADGRQVELITISDAGHQWPGGESNRPIARMLFSPDPPSTALDANAVIWAFFQRHPAPQ
jgi:polyhydroxybutyrate depolymerase